MKKIFIIPAVLILLSYLLPACVKEENDPCDSTKATSINRSIQVDIAVTEEGGNPPYSRPATGETVSVEFTKYPCEGGSKGYFKMDGVTEGTGSFLPTMPNYNFNNTKDRIEVVVTIPYTTDNGSPEEYSESFEITYDDAKQFSGNVIVDFPVTLVK